MDLRSGARSGGKQKKPAIKLEHTLGFPGLGTLTWLHSFKLAAFLSPFMCVFRKEEKRWSYLRVIKVEMKYENTCKNTN